MAFKYYSSLAFLAVATILLLAAGNAEARGHHRRHPDLCNETDGNKVRCRLLLRGDRNPVSATYKSISQLISDTNKAKALAASFHKVPPQTLKGLKSCIGSYNNAIFDLQKALAALKSRDKPTTRINISAVLTDIEDCADNFEQFGLRSPIESTNNGLVDLTRTALALAFQLPTRF